MKIRTKNKVCTKNNIEQYLLQNRLIDTEINSNQKMNYLENSKITKNKLKSKKKKSKKSKKGKSKSLNLDKSIYE